MKTPEQWRREMLERLGDDDPSWPAIACAVLGEALAERDAALAGAQRAERLARCVLADHQEEYRPQWEEARRLAAEEVRGRVLAWLRGEMGDGSDYIRRVELGRAAEFVSALGPAREPLPPAEAERQLEALREGVRGVIEWAKGKAYGCSTCAEIGPRLRALLGEGGA